MGGGVGVKGNLGKIERKSALLARRNRKFLIIGGCTTPPPPRFRGPCHFLHDEFFIQLVDCTSILGGFAMIFAKQLFPNFDSKFAYYFKRFCRILRRDRKGNGHIYDNLF